MPHISILIIYTIRKTYLVCSILVNSRIEKDKKDDQVNVEVYTWLYSGKMGMRFINNLIRLS